MSEKYFLRPPQKQVKTKPTFQTTIFRAKFTFWPIKLNTYMQEIKFTSHKLYLFGLLFSINVKEHSYRPKYTLSFSICPNLNDSQTFKSSSCKKIFSSVYVIDATCFDECFFVPCDNWKTLRSLLLVLDIFNRQIVVFLEASFLKEVCILRKNIFACLFSVHNAISVHVMNKNV